MHANRNDMLAVVFFVLLVWVIPRFALFYKDFDAQLPWLTRVVVGLGEGLSRNLFPIALFVVALFFFFDQERIVLAFGSAGIIAQIHILAEGVTIPAPSADDPKRSMRPLRSGCTAISASRSVSPSMKLSGS